MENFVFVGIDLGWIVGLSILGFFGLLTLVFFLFHRHYIKGSGYYDDGWAIGAGITGFLSVITLVIMAGCAIPFNSKYWGAYNVTGTVDEITNSFSDASGQISANPVIDFSAIDTPVEVGDPRFLRLVGENVTLRCTVAWHYKAADTYNCALVSVN